MREPIGEETLRRVAKMDRVTAWIAEKALAEAGPRVLEVGAGMGTFTELLLPRERVVAVEPNVEHGSRLAEMAEAHLELRIVSCDFTAPECLSLAGESCDTVICLNVLEHIADDRRALENMRHVLAPGGRLVLLVPALRGLYGTLDTFLYHHRRYNKAELREKLESAGFRIRTLSWFNFFGMFGWWLNARILRRKILPTDQLVLYNTLVPFFRKFEALTGPPIGQSLWAIAEK